MVKRMLDCSASDFKKFKKEDWIKSIAQSEGRVIAAESIGAAMPMLTDVTNAELAASMGADILLLNVFDVDNPVINALPKCSPMNVVKEIKNLTGNRMIGINLEPVENEASDDNDGNLWSISDGRRATVKNAVKAHEMGVDMILLTGNPGNGVSNKAILDSLKSISGELGSKIVLAAGKMHAAGVISEGGEKILTKEEVAAFVDAGADIILLPAPGTVPGITLEYAHDIISYAHSLGALTITSIGTSQEGADVSTIRQIALMCKMAGTDIHHIGDSGYIGMALPENIQAYSIAVRGVRHTYHRMAMSINR